MTAVPQWHVEDMRTTDAELVRGSMSGDRAAFAAIYDRYADRLHDFCVGMLRDLDGAADCVQETFCIAATRLPQLRDPDRLRPWLYSIARNEALRRLRELRRETPSDELPDHESDDADAETLSARTELANLIAEAAGGLSDRDRAVLDLTFRHGLDGPELAEALGVSRASANTMVSRLRQTVERSLGALLVSRRAQKNNQGCAELRGILASWDGQFTVLMRKRISRHIESCAVCDEERRRLVSPTALLAAAPVMIPAPKWLRDKTMHDIDLVSHDTAMANGADRSTDVRGARADRRRMMVAALLIAELAAATALLIAYINSSATPVSPAEVSQTATPDPPSAPPPLPPPPPAPPPRDEPTPRSAPPPQPPPSIVVVPPPVPEADVPPAEEPPATPAAPSTKPPMSFSPTAVVTPAPPPDSDGGGNRRSSRAGAP
ncbi:RNA polymerase sigma factor, sigma-70 family [Mycolicibacterium rutilum]|uniref:RNA polymerase sigma factor, sigma-70 family n=1 Tax=Mycolicibacterium rutilum TaxID=370526 RepID=A0A1H6LHC7_MYCRU|nr:sigma-70 family RNA polymerase sigma factor [Mycolicibacterium rutilum]SEH84711.1 RNA polymerase sigma factor, sigma-70 family [Mycolicibacterium rutilum]